MNTRIKGVIFDMDGTLVDNMHFHQQAWFAFLDKHGVIVSEAEYHEKNAGTITEIIPKFFPDITDAAEIMRLGLEKEEMYRNLYRMEIRSLPGLETFMQALSDAGILMGLATAADRGNIDFTIDALGLRRYFHAIIGSEEVRYGKPHPDVFLKAAAALGKDPGECMAFEDSTPGIRSAIAAGMKVTGLATTHRREELEAFPLHAIIENYVISDPVGFLNGSS